MECEHQWETLDSWDRIVHYVPGGFLSDGHVQYEKVYLQKCKKCGMLHKTD